MSDPVSAAVLSDRMSQQVPVLSEANLPISSRLGRQVSSHIEWATLSLYHNLHSDSGFGKRRSAQGTQQSVQGCQARCALPLTLDLVPPRRDLRIMASEDVHVPIPGARENHAITRTAGPNQIRQIHQNHPEIAADQPGTETRPCPGLIFHSSLRICWTEPV